MQTMHAKKFENERKGSVLLFSGGLDSFCGWWVLGKPNWLHFKFSQNVISKGETNFTEYLIKECEEFADKGKIIELDTTRYTKEYLCDNRGVKNSFILFPRDILMIFAAWSEGYNVIWQGWQGDDFGYNKQNAEIRNNYYMQLVNNISSIVADKVLIDNPLWKYSKSELVRGAVNSGCKEEWLWKSHSCANNLIDDLNIHCGYCCNCLERWVAFRSSGVKDNTIYNEHPITMCKKTMSNFINNTDHKFYLNMLESIKNDEKHNLTNIAENPVTFPKKIEDPQICYI